MKYCALLNNTYNIGDDLQSVAAMRFLPTVDYYAFKEKLSLFKCDDTEKPKIILNSWYMWKTKNFPPSSDLDPLLISMHFSEQCRKKILTKQTKEWMKKHGPVGCRDIDTQNWLLENGIDAYFSGCLTLTLTENPNLRNKNGFILCIDVSDKVVETIKKRSDKQVLVLSKNIFGAFSAKSRLEISKMFIYLYHQASVVVTGNMHTSLPSLAINTPVCLLTDENGGPDVAKRFSGLIDFFNHYTTKEFIENDVYDLNTPPANPMTHLDLRHSLEEKCKDFTGYDRNTPTLEDNYNPTLELHKLLSYCTYTGKKEHKALLATSRFVLLRVFLERAFFNKDKHSLDY